MSLSTLRERVYAERDLADAWRVAESAAEEAWGQVKYHDWVVKRAYEALWHKKPEDDMTRWEMVRRSIVFYRSQLVVHQEVYKRLAALAAEAERRWEESPGPLPGEEFRWDVIAKGGETMCAPGDLPSLSSCDGAELRKILWEPVTPGDDDLMIGEFVEYVPTSPDHLPPGDGAGN